MTWTVTFYSEKVESQTLALPAGILANLLHILELIEEFGPSLGRPHTAPLGKGLFEIRAKGPEGISRSLFCTIKGQEIVILHTFIKKSQKIPKKHMALARKRMKEVTDND
ncbi:MAG: type II toxin-antitoxin system RelE/ParE family toxin [Proteobacteria bacterium]|nr:type II toxin-antitoxin system RelE/ParE family toxin [Pseudomonadota bacterium]